MKSETGCELQDLKNKIEEIESTATNQKNNLMIAYAKSKAKFKVGDIIKDGERAIIIDKLSFHQNEGCGYGKFNPYVSYSGVLLTKAVKPRKDGQRSNISDYSETVVIVK